MYRQLNHSDLTKRILLSHELIKRYFAIIFLNESIGSHLYYTRITKVNSIIFAYFHINQEKK